ncbi:hypothetical protein [Sporolituus thermophilus]|uniref:Uncharacterized protein n=1 Tax=Sporolituus thermophilus DSM 23256 TaxID=1123285 RepID=A0A1G7MI69_9FIRM|nr:hypothetical protein [Sporolituus thermophilus]SDF61411.1 hypothetical protein SAMN05660235_02176 [Sporolituus thermophilus DSM 23256]
MELFYTYIFHDRSGKKSIFKIFVSVVVMVMVGTALQTGFQIAPSAPNAGLGAIHSGVGNFHILNFGAGNLNLLPIPPGGGRGGNKPVQAGDRIETPVQNGQQTIIEVEATVTVDTDKVKFRPMLVDPDQPREAKEYEYPDMPGLKWKNPQKIAEERQEWLQKIAAERDRQQAELRQQQGQYVLPQPR